MDIKTRSLRAVVILFLLIPSILFTSGEARVEHQIEPIIAPTESVQSASGYVVELIADPNPNKFFVPPPVVPVPEGPLAPQTVAITVNYRTPANPGTCDTDTYGALADWSIDARTAFEYAINIWESVLNGSRTIVIDACWHSGMEYIILGSAGPYDSYANFPNAPETDMFYPVALANELAGADQNGADPEIRAQFNSNRDWYLGTDGDTPITQHDFVSVVLHEIAHGLGFVGGMAVNTEESKPCGGTTVGLGCWVDDYPFIYDDFTMHYKSSPLPGYYYLINYDNPSTTLGDALTSDSVYFEAGDDYFPLYTPSQWNQGSSYSHLDESYNNTINALMTFSISTGEAIHHPGPVTLDIFQAIGWQVINRSYVYVEAGFTGTELGTSTNPFNTVIEGVHAVRDGGTVFIRAGSYNETMTINRPMTLDGDGAVIGQ